MARQRNARVLDNSITTVDGLTIAGIGDPEFTPDKSENAAGRERRRPGSSPLLRSGDRAGRHDPHVEDQGRTWRWCTTRRWRRRWPVRCPLVLAGHLHKREVSTLAAPAAGADGSASPAPTPTAEPMQTRLMVEGSTGGAGLRGLEKEEPTPLALSVLYFDEQHDLKAYDDIQLGGTGQSQVTLERKVVGQEPSRRRTRPSTTASRRASPRAARALTGTHRAGTHRRTSADASGPAAG